MYVERNAADAESSSRPLSPSPLCEGGGGAKLPSTLKVCVGAAWRPHLLYSPQYPAPILRISDRTITLQDTVYICRTDTLIRTQTITQKERYIPPFYRFCTITFATFATFATLTFSIHLLLRYLKRPL